MVLVDKLSSTDVIILVICECGRYEIGFGCRTVLSVVRCGCRVRWKVDVVGSCSWSRWLVVGGSSMKWRSRCVVSA